MNAEHLLQHFDRLSEAPDAILRLRRFILDLAVRGKLVEQDPNDELAAELLKRIEAEKARLVKEGKLKKTSAGSADNSSDTSFDLPRSWVRVCLGDVAQYGLSDKVNSNKDIADDTWVLDLEDIEKNTSRLIERIPSSARPFRSTKTIFQRGDVLFGKLRPYLNKVLVANEDGVCTTEIVPIRGYCNIVPEYIKLVFMSPVTMRRVDRLMYGMKMPRLGTNDAILLEFPLAPLAEQHRIVAKVDELMALCDQLEAAKAEREQSRDRLLAANLHHLNQPADDEEAFREHVRFTFNHLPRITTRPAHIKQLRQTILNLAVRGKLVEQDRNDEPIKSILSGLDAAEENIFKVPHTWGWRHISDLSVLVTDGEHATPTRISEQQVPLVTAKNVRDGEMDYTTTDWVSFDTAEKAWRRCRPMVGDILLVCVGATTGRLCILREQKDMVLVRSVALIRPSNIIDVDYLALAIRTPLGQSQIWNNVKTSAQPCLYINRINSLIFPLPPIAEQHRIVAKVDELMALCDQLENQLTATETDSRRLLEAVLHEALMPTLDQVA